jgi:hypothetical protein
MNNRTFEKKLKESIIAGVSQKDYEKMVKKALKESIKMKNIISFLLIFLGIIILAGDSDNFTFFCLSKLFGIVITFLGCILMPKSLWE